MFRTWGKVIVPVLLLLVIIALGCVGWFLLQISTLKPIATQRLGDSLYVVKGSIGNLFLIGGSGHFIAFDGADNPKKIVQALKQLSIQPEQIDALFLTHSDADHVGSVPLFAKARLYLSADEVPLITGVTPRHLFGLPHFNKLPTATYQTLADGDSIVINGITVRAIAAPGHTPGSMCFQVGDMLFAGDLCLLRKGEIHPMLRIFTEDIAGNKASIRRIARMPFIKRLYTAHTGFTTGAQQAFEAWH